VLLRLRLLQSCRTRGGPKEELGLWWSDGAGGGGGGGVVMLVCGEGMLRRWTHRLGMWSASVYLYAGV